MALRDADEVLLTAIFARLAAQEPTLKVFTVVPEDQAPPYLKVELVESTVDDEKDADADWITVEFSVFSTGSGVPGAASMLECLRLRNRAMKALTETPLSLSGGFFADIVLRAGRSITEEFDLKYIYFHGTFRLRWRVRDTTGG